MKKTISNLDKETHRPAPLPRARVDATLCAGATRIATIQKRDVPNSPILVFIRADLTRAYVSQDRNSVALGNSPCKQMMCTWVGNIFNRVKLVDACPFLDVELLRISRLGFAFLYIARYPRYSNYPEQILSSRQLFESNATLKLQKHETASSTSVLVYSSLQPGVCSCSSCPSSMIAAKTICSMFSVQ